MPLLDYFSENPLKEIVLTLDLDHVLYQTLIGLLYLLLHQFYRRFLVNILYPILIQLLYLFQSLD